MAHFGMKILSDTGSTYNYNSNERTHDGRLSHNAISGVILLETTEEITLSSLNFFGQRAVAGTTDVTLHIHECTEDPAGGDPLWRPTNAAVALATATISGVSDTLQLWSVPISTTIPAGKKLMVSLLFPGVTLLITDNTDDLGIETPTASSSADAGTTWTNFAESLAIWAEFEDLQDNPITPNFLEAPLFTFTAA